MQLTIKGKAATKKRKILKKPKSSIIDVEKLNISKETINNSNRNSVCKKQYR